MSNANSFINNYVAATQTLISVMDQLRHYNDMIAADSTLITRYFNNTETPSHRTDIVAADVTAAKDAAVQMLFTFDSGNPTQKSSFFKLAP